MKKETLVSSLVSVAATAGALLISPKFAIAVFAICVVATILVQTFWKERVSEPSLRERAQKRVEQLQQGGTNVGGSITQNANPTINIYPPAVSVATPSPAVTAPSIAAIKPNIEFGEVKEYQVYLNPESNKFYMGAQAQNFTRAILIQVINGAGPGTRKVTVKAGARFEQEGKHTAVTPMTWIGEY